MKIQKAALITGAGSGIGAATAREFAKHGYFVYLLGRNKEKLQEVALGCESGASVIGCDLRDPGQIDKKIPDLLATKVHRLEVLVNNAGTFERRPLLEESDAHWTEQFETHVLAPQRLARHIVPYFRNQGGGAITNVSSTLGLRPVALTASYSAMKAALINWTQCLALETGTEGIRVNCVCPGLVDTPIHAFHHLPEKDKQQTLEKMKSLQPLGRIGSPEDIARSVYFLSSPESAWTTGAVLAVDGGINLT